VHTERDNLKTNGNIVDDDLQQQSIFGIFHCCPRRGYFDGTRAAAAAAATTTTMMPRQNKNRRAAA